MGARNKNETSSRILTAAFTCIAAKGFGNVTLREIAEEAGVALSQLNYYFHNKEGLFLQVLLLIKKEYLEALEIRMAACATSREKIVFLITYNRSLMTTNTAWYRVFMDFFSLAMGPGAFNKDMNEFIGEISAAIERQLGQDLPLKGDLGGRSTYLLTRMILGTSFGVAMQYLLNPAEAGVLDSFDALLVNFA